MLDREVRDLGEEPSVTAARLALVRGVHRAAGSSLGLPGARERGPVGRGGPSGGSLT